MFAALQEYHIKTSRQQHDSSVTSIRFQPLPIISTDPQRDFKQNSSTEAKRCKAVLGRSSLPAAERPQARSAAGSFFCSSAQSPTFPGASHGQTEPWTVCDFPRNVLFSHPNNTDRNQQTNVLGNCEVASALNIDSLDAVNQGDGSFSRSRICCRASFARCFSSS